jgi:tetratricopeptide (TPR) repeat protein
LQKPEPQIKASRVQGVDIRKLPLGPEEAFVFSRVEQATSVADIVLTTGLANQSVTKALHRLATLGAVTLRDESGTLIVPRKPTPAKPLKPAAPVPTFPSLYPESELAEEAALSPERKRQLLDWYHGADLLTHYELFGLPNDATKKEIKDGYFEVVRVFHPDRYFGKKLGSFKSKLERTFQRLTEAHDILSRPKAREEYDLQISRKSALSEEKQSQRDEIAARIADYFEQLHSRPTLDAVAAETKLDSSPPLSDRTTSPGPSTPAQPAASPQPPPATRRRSSPRPPPGSNPPTSKRTTRPPPGGSDDTRRQEFAKKLAGGRAPSDPPVAERNTSNSNVKRYLAMADEALANDDPLAAANALKLALHLEPDAPHIALRLASAEKAAAVKMAPHNLTLARNAEAKRHYEAAAELYAKVGLGKPSAEVFERAASCLLLVKKDLRRAADLAKQATTLDPNRVDLRMLLAKIYEEANMKQSALNELERATKLAPQDASIKEMMRRLKRGDG